MKYRQSLAYDRNCAQNFVMKRDWESGSRSLRGEAQAKLLKSCCCRQSRLFGRADSCRMAASKPISHFWDWGKNIFCVGRNYAAHAEELKNALPTEPLFFLKPSSAYVREGHPILQPYYCNKLHHEVELGVVIGRRTQAVPQEAALGHVAGYALCLDMTARDVQEECKKKGLPWTLAKGFNTSCPVSDFVPKEKVPDPHRLKIWLKVNGELRQEGNTSGMIFTVPYIISYLSGIVTLEEGDIVLTGSPEGVSAVQEKDEIEAGIEGLLKMRFQVARQKSRP